MLSSLTGAGTTHQLPWRMTAPLGGRRRNALNTPEQEAEP
jgi:hypothetical protein